MDNSISIVHSTEVLGKSFQIYGTKDAPLFLAKDVAEWIEHSDTSTMLRTVDDDEKLTQTMFVSGQRRCCWFLTEYGLYEVLMQSRKPIAKEFKKQVKRILSEIRQTGSYGADNLNHALAMFASTITTMQQNMLTMQQSINELQTRTIPLSLPGDDLPSDILRSIRALGGVATREEIADEVGCDKDELLLALKDLLVSNRICETRRWSLANGTRKDCYCLPENNGIVKKLVDHSPSRPEVRKHGNSSIFCALRHELTGETKYFSSMRKALKFLNISTYGVSYELALTIKKDHWEFVEINR